METKTWHQIHCIWIYFCIWWQIFQIKSLFFFFSARQPTSAGIRITISQLSSLRKKYHGSYSVGYKVPSKNKILFSFISGENRALATPSWALFSTIIWPTVMRWWEGEHQEEETDSVGSEHTCACGFSQDLRVIQPV